MNLEFLKKLICLSVLTMWGIVFNLHAQSTGLGDTSSKTILKVQKPALNTKSLSLLDPERFSMKQNYIMNFSSTNGNGGLMGMYINSMEYRFNAPLIMRLKVAYQSQTGMLFGNKDSYTGMSRYNQGRLYVPSFDLIYMPFKNTTVSFCYRDFSSVRSSYYNRYNRYSSGFDYGYDMQMYNLLYGYDQFRR